MNTILVPGFRPDGEIERAFQRAKLAALRALPIEKEHADPRAANGPSDDAIREIKREAKTACRAFGHKLLQQRIHVAVVPENEMVSNVKPKKKIEVAGWANKRWLAEQFGVLPTSMAAFLANNQRFLASYKIKVQGLGVLYAVNAVRYLRSIPTGRERWEMWCKARPVCPPLPTFK